MHKVRQDLMKCFLKRNTIKILLVKGNLCLASSEWLDTQQSLTDFITHRVSKCLFLFCRCESRDQDRCNVLPKVTQGDSGNAKNKFQDLRSCPVSSGGQLRLSLLSYAIQELPPRITFSKAHLLLLYPRENIQSTQLIWVRFTP